MLLDNYQYYIKLKFTSRYHLSLTNNVYLFLFLCEFQLNKYQINDKRVYHSTGTRDRIPPFFMKKHFPVFFFLFVINLCYIIREISLFHIIREISLFHIIREISLFHSIREISLFHIIREISLFPPVYYPAPATINFNIHQRNLTLSSSLLSSPYQY